MSCAIRSEQAQRVADHHVSGAVAVRRCHGPIPSEVKRADLRGDPLPKAPFLAGRILAGRLACEDLVAQLDQADLQRHLADKVANRLDGAGRRLVRIEDSLHLLGGSLAYDGFVRVTCIAEDKVQQPCAPHPGRERVKFLQGDAVLEQPGGVSLPVGRCRADGCASARSLLLELAA